MLVLIPCFQISPVWYAFSCVDGGGDPVGAYPVCDVFDASCMQPLPTSCIRCWFRWSLPLNRSAGPVGQGGVQLDRHMRLSPLPSQPLLVHHFAVQRLVHV